KAENERFQLPDDVAEYIARSIKSNVRELEGALTRLMAYASLTGVSISLATAQQVLRNIIASQEKRVTIDLIQKRVSEHFDLREQDLKIRSNTRAIAFPRQVAMYIVKQLTTASLPEIGRQFGGKHHTTVLHSINKIEELRRSDKDLNRTITRLIDALQKFADFLLKSFGARPVPLQAAFPFYPQGCNELFTLRLATKSCGEELKKVRRIC